ncbi:MAG: poly-gamma-glutamate hydrolase family protein [Bacteriovoracaceae bacterium]|jgi:phage replication-related protein YjqB (UPF0714/DUF867 family)|nr:hypothetical protein [Halobacteriovoraceae bacterium]MDP7321524.1 poly-gamma-glutamate hydrolase family protein [Bacteriovoracaceae bacterium]
MFFFRFFIFLFISGFIFLSCTHQQGLWGTNKSFQDLKAKSQQYQINYQNRKSSSLILAIHGGLIEQGTSQLLYAIAKSDYSFYEFKGLVAPDYNSKILQSGYLHLTSHKYDDPKLIELASQTNFCLSLHGFPAKKTQVDFCLGGQNGKLRKKLAKALQREFPQLKTCELCCPPYLGLHQNNVVNLCQSKGVQIELSPNIRKILISPPKKPIAKRLIKTLRLFLANTTNQ